MTSTLNLATATPAQIDTEWVEAVAPAVAKINRAEALRKRAERMRTSDDNGKKFNLAKAERKRAARDEAEALRVEGRTELETASAPFKTEWDNRGGWMRAYKVPGGHVHSATSCHSLYFTTQIVMLPELSGMTQEEIVDLAGEGACTFCFPDAPVSDRPCRIFTPDEKAQQADKAEREAKRAAKAAKAAANAIMDVDGSPLLDSHGMVIKTLRTARIELNTARWYMNSQNPKQAEKMTAAYHRIIAAISAKTGESIEELAVKADEKYRKDGGL